MKAFFAGIGRFLFGKTESSNNTKQQQPMVEPLENRQFLSVSMLAAQSCGCDSPIVEAALPAASPAIGKWKGTIQTNLRPRPFKAMVNIQSVTPAGRINGVVSVPFLVDNYKFDINTRKSTMKPDGSFTVRFNKFGVSGTFKGHYDEPSKHVVGDFSATAPARTVTGTFDFARL
jgi:hypothetical protein